MLTRSQVAQQIGRSVATVRRMEGKSLHPQLGPRGVRLFDADEVEEVAAFVAESGRALDGYTVFDGQSSGCARRLGATTQRRLNESTHEVARLRTLLQQTRATHSAWRARLEDAVEGLIASARTPDDELLEALEDLVDVLRSR